VLVGTLQKIIVPDPLQLYVHDGHSFAVPQSRERNLALDSFGWLSMVAGWGIYECLGCWRTVFAVFDLELFELIFRYSSPPLQSSLRDRLSQSIELLYMGVRLPDALTDCIQGFRKY
jgi:hypothetical protein